MLKKLTIALFLFLSSVMALNAAPIESFGDFIKSFEKTAISAGISKQTYRNATKNLTPIANIPGLVRSQPEFTTPIWVYIDKRVSASRIARGKQAFAANVELFNRIAKTYGVDPAILASIWGMETDYGGVLNNKKLIKPIIASLATLVHQRRDRLKEDEKELIAALKLIQSYGWEKETLVGSWAGAIGHTQVIASGLLKNGTDGDGDGIINPHTSLADALATSAKFLVSLGYVSGVDWGFEVDLPNNFDYSLATRTKLRPIDFFVNKGVKRVKGREFSDLNTFVFLYIPAGKTGPKFLMTQNYLVLKAYNFSDSYALSVAHLADRLKGSGAFTSPWPKQTKFPNLKQRIYIQKRLKQLGFYDGEVDGRLGPITQKAYSQFQSSNGQTGDGFITLKSYEILKK